MSEPTINPREWTAINTWAIHTPSISKAARVAAHLNKHVHRSRQAGVLDGIEWMCLARFEERLKQQAGA